MDRKQHATQDTVCHHPHPTAPSLLRFARFRIRAGRHLVGSILCITTCRPHSGSLDRSGTLHCIKRLALRCTRILGLLCDLNILKTATTQHSSATPVPCATDESKRTLQDPLSGTPTELPNYRKLCMDNLYTARSGVATGGELFANQSELENCSTSGNTLHCSFKELGTSQQKNWASMDAHDSVPCICKPLVACSWVLD